MLRNAGCLIPLGPLLDGVIITGDEIRGLMEGRLYVEATATGTTALTSWAREHNVGLGRKYASELTRRAPARAA